MKYQVERNSKYDFIGQSYANSYPNLHKYPATMLPQIGIELFKELNITKGKLLDPYCGSGSSFIVGLDRGLNEMYGFDINPLAVLISRTKFCKIDIERVKLLRQRLRNKLYEFVKIEENLRALEIPKFYNITFWFSKQVLQNLTVIKYFINKIKEKDIKRMFLVPFSETVRECSYTRNSEFKLYRMKPEDILRFNPDVFGIYFDKLNNTIEIYERYYLPKLTNAKININYSKLPQRENYFDVVLTSPPYGDSRTTVAYGQFSMFSNEWLGIKHARQIDYLLMGGKLVKENYKRGLIVDYINKIADESKKRALEVSSFYYDLENSIKDVAKSIKKGGISSFIVGDRTVKNVQLPTDQFIAEKFEENGFKHLFTYERLLGNKAMPLQNSPSNKVGERKGTMTKEFIVVCEKSNKSQ
jgi:tRNA G10  N-methylase Trm11